METQFYKDDVVKIINGNKDFLFQHFHVHHQDPQGSVLLSISSAQAHNISYAIRHADNTYLISLMPTQLLLVSRSLENRVKNFLLVHNFATKK